MSRRRIAVTVGILFIVQMVTAMIGTSLIQAFVEGDTATAPLRAGVLLMMCSGLAVVAIGVLMYQVLKVVNGAWPSGTRSSESSSSPSPPRAASTS